MNSNDCAGYNLVGLSSSLAILISQQLDVEDLTILAVFITALGDNLALLAAAKGL